MTEAITLPLEQRSVADFIEDVNKLTVEIQELYCSDSIPWILGVSWGKDSSTILQLVWNAIATLAPEKRKKKVYVITTDTQVENPIVSHWVRRCIEQIKSHVTLDEMRTFANCPSFDELLEQLAYGEVQQGAPANSLAHPLTIGWGRRDLVCFPSQAQRALELFPDAKLHWFENCGHFPQWDVPQEVVRSILAST